MTEQDDETPIVFNRKAMSAMAQSVGGFVREECGKLQETIRTLQTKVDKQAQQLSANQRHCQALEKKIAELSK